MRKKCSIDKSKTLIHEREAMMRLRIAKDVNRYLFGLPEEIVNHTDKKER